MSKVNVVDRPLSVANETGWMIAWLIRNPEPVLLTQRNARIPCSIALVLSIYVVAQPPSTAHLQAVIDL